MAAAVPLPIPSLEAGPGTVAFTSVGPQPVADASQHAAAQLVVNQQVEAAAMAAQLRQSRGVVANAASNHMVAAYSHRPVVPTSPSDVLRSAGIAAPAMAQSLATRYEHHNSPHPLLRHPPPHSAVKPGTSH